MNTTTPPPILGGQGRTASDLAKGPRLGLLLVRRWWRLPPLPMLVVGIAPALGLFLGALFAEACTALGRAW